MYRIARNGPRFPGSIDTQRRSKLCKHALGIILVAKDHSLQNINNEVHRLQCLSSLPAQNAFMHLLVRPEKPLERPESSEHQQPPQSTLGNDGAVPSDRVFWALRTVSWAAVWTDRFAETVRGRPRPLLPEASCCLLDEEVDRVFNSDGGRQRLYRQLLPHPHTCTCPLRPAVLVL